jgi:hypothetical protein
MCKSKDCQHKKESPIKDWKHRCKFGPDGRKLKKGTVIAGWNDMATTHPELAKELIGNQTKYVAGTREKLDWKCSTCGYEWPATGNNRVRGSGCGCCSNKVVVPGINDMATTHPELAKELIGDPRKYVAGTGKILNWKCSICCNKWPALGNDRVQGKGCPSCNPGGHDQTKPSFVYLICRPGQIQYGIMNIWTSRLKDHARKGWELLDKIEVTGRKARSLETKIKKTLRAKGIPTGREAFREKFEGSTEAFQEVDLYVRSIRGLCRKLGIDLDAFLAA